MKETECFGDWINTPFGPEDPHCEPEEDFKHWDDDPYAKPDICGWEDK